jgi:hypothetical protein
MAEIFIEFIFLVFYDQAYIFNNTYIKFPSADKYSLMESLAIPPSA